MIMLMSSIEISGQVCEIRFGEGMRHCCYSRNPSSSLHFSRFSSIFTCMAWLVSNSQSKHFLAMAKTASFRLSDSNITFMPFLLYHFILFLQLFHPTCKIHNLSNFDPNLMGFFVLPSSWSLVFYHYFSRFFGWVIFKWP